MFPKLTMLNGKGVRSFIVAGATEGADGLKPVQPSFVSDDIRGVVESFLTDFFRRYDSDRHSLANVYHESGVFSHYYVKDQRASDPYHNNNRNLHSVPTNALGLSIFFVCVS